MHVEGLARTKDDIVQDAVRDLFSATDFQDVLVKAHKVFNCYPQKSVSLNDIFRCGSSLIPWVASKIFQYS